MTRASRPLPLPGAGGPRTQPRCLELRTEQRRMAVMALASCAWLLGAVVIGAPEALGYLAPTLAILSLLALGRYPGAAALERRLGARRAASRRRPGRAGRGFRLALALPRGGALLASGLAGRAPPRIVD
jgi:hypothetical protein